MTIKALDGPPGASAMLIEALARRTRTSRRLMASLSGAPQLTSPVPFYHLGLEAVPLDDPLSAAVQTGWRFPIVGAEAPALAAVHDGDDGPSYEGISHGALARRFMQAAFLADEMLGSSPDEFEPRLLDVPALQYVALWLKGPENYFVALLEGHPPGYAPLRLQSNIWDDLRARRASRDGGLAAARTNMSPTN